MDRPRESGKCIWLITYAACSPSITHTILRDAGIDCVECHTISWRESKYTLLRLNKSKRTRLSTIKNAMLKMEESRGVRGSHIIGYDTLTSNTKEGSVKEHPGFMRMVQLLNQKSTELESWINEGDVHTNKRGLLWQHIEDTDPADMTHAQLVHRVRTLAPLALENTRIQSEIDNLTIGVAVVETPKQPTTLNVLMTYRMDKNARNTMKRLTKIEKSMNKVNSFDGSGEIYAAWNSLMPNLHKLGFTFQDAQTRVKALQTAGVLESFELVRHAHVPDARLYEKAMHIYFRDVRVYKRKEFFAADADDINRFFNIVESQDADHSVESDQWVYALAKARAS